MCASPLLGDVPDDLQDREERKQAQEQVSQREDYQKNKNTEENVDKDYYQYNYWRVPGELQIDDLLLDYD